MALSEIENVLKFLVINVFHFPSIMMGSYSRMSTYLRVDALLLKFNEVRTKLIFSYTRIRLTMLIWIYVIKYQTIVHFRGLKVGRLVNGWALSGEVVAYQGLAKGGFIWEGRLIDALLYRNMQFSDEMQKWEYFASLCK